MKNKYKAVECPVCKEVNVIPTAFYYREPLPVDDMVKGRYCKHLFIGQDDITVQHKGKIVARYSFKNISEKAAKTS
jgi:hypothetical protein